MKKLKVCIVGLGFAGSVHTDAYNSIPDKVKIVAVCDRNLEKAKMMSKSYGAKAYTDYREMLKKEKPDIVDVCVPHHAHAEVVVAAANAGANVIVEKPLAPNLEDANRMIEATKKAGVKFMVAEDQLFLPAHRMAKDLIDKGAIGKIFMARALSVVCDKPVEQNAWQLDPKNLGVLMDMGVHYFMALDWMVGEIESVNAMKGKVVVDLKGKEYDDNAFTILKFKNGALGEVALTSCAVTEQYNRLEFYGTEGTIIIDHSWEKPLMYHSTHPETMTDGWVRPDVEHLTYPGYYPIAFGYEVKHFVDCVLKNKTPDVTGEYGRRAVGVALTAYKSAKSGKIQKVENI
jgi:predicted dehydrogenase